jgi:hypothetical protein
MVELTDGRIIDLIRAKMQQFSSFFVKTDLRRCRLPEARSQVMGAVVYALQELDIES